MLGMSAKMVRHYGTRVIAKTAAASVRAGTFI
jgi:hypothetical protein